MFRRASLVVWICLVATGCGKDRDPVSGPDKVIGPSGGTVTLQDDSATLQVPPGAVEEETELSLKRPDSPPGSVPEGVMVNTIVEVEPAGVTFAKPVELTLTYRAGDLLQPDTTWLRMVQVVSNRKLGPTLLVIHDSETRTLSARVTRIGTYALADLERADVIVETSQKPITDVDFLFVVDTSGSMGEEQNNLGHNFPKLLDKLDQTKLDYRVGVISTDLGAGTYDVIGCEVAGGDGGKLQNTPRLEGCFPPSDPWIEKIGGSTNVPGDDVSAAFFCISQLGVGGCGFEHTLESARRALDPALNVNPGFVRDNAALAIMFLTDEDDCSAKNSSLFDPSQSTLSDPLGPLTSFRCFEFGIECDINDRTIVGPRKDCHPAGDWLYKVEDYVTFFRGLKPAGQLVMAAIAGPTDKVEVGMDTSGGRQDPRLKPSCQTSMGMALPAIRLEAVVKAFGSRGQFNMGKSDSGQTIPVNICSPDYSPALRHIGDLLVSAPLLSWCLPYDPVDTNPLTPELEGDCIVVGSKVGQVPSCSPGSTKPCFSLSSYPKCPNSNSAAALENLTPAQLGDMAQLRCLVLD